MQFSCQHLSPFSEYQEIDLNARKLISSLDKGGISGDRLFKASGQTN
jgi:hypothetical protein